MRVLKLAKILEIQGPFCFECKEVKLVETFEQPIHGGLVKGNICFSSKLNQFICTDCKFKNKRLLPNKMFF